MISEMKLESFGYEELLGGHDLGDAIERAFGHNGLGIAVVTGVPEVAACRRELFLLGHIFANLPEGERTRYEHPESHFSLGWSHGKEVLEEGRPDLAKGSFYANPCHDAPFAHDPEAEKAHLSFAHPNIWPDDAAASLSGFSREFKALGQAVVRVGALVGRHCDRYLESVHPGYERGKLERIVSSSRCHKARLLHYFPVDKLPQHADETPKTEGANLDDVDFSDWCGWHHDHSSLTGLVPSMMLNAAGEEVENKDPNCGLFIRSRQGNLVKVTLPAGEAPSSCLLFQIGETTQVHSGGMLQATPHAVRATSQPGKIWSGPREAVALVLSSSFVCTTLS